MNQQPTYYHQPRGRGYNNRGRGRGRGFGRGFGRGSKSGNITCYYCKAEGHKRHECPELNKQEQHNNPNTRPSR